MKKLLIGCFFLIFIITIVNNILLNNTERNKIVINLENNEIDNKKIYMNITSSIEFSIDVKDINYLENNSSDIIIGKIKSIDGATNYNEKEKEYTFVSTYGIVQIESIIKNNSNFSINDTISFVRMGGIISVYEYEKSLEQRQIIKQKIDKLSYDEKRNLYVKMYVENDIEPEEGKTYLMYLSYDNEANKYYIIGFESGLREYKKDTKQVKNNETYKWEKIKYNI